LADDERWITIVLPAADPPTAADSVAK